MLRNGPPYPITKTVLLQCLRDETFYRACPAFFFMRDQARAVIAQLDAALAGQTKPSGDCAACEIPERMADGLMETFARVAVALYAESPELLEPLAGYIALRRRYRPRPVLLYYKTGDGAPVRKIEF